MAQNQDILAPTTEPQEQAPRDTINVQATPAAFGAPIAAGLEKLGSGITQAGNFWGEVQTDHVTNGVLQQLSDINERAKTLKGQDALDAQGEILQGAQNAIKQGRDELSLPSQQLAFDNATKNMWFRYFQPQLNNHFNQQGQDVAIATNKATLSQTIGFVPSVAGNQDAVDNFAEDAAHAGAKIAQAQFGLNAPQEIIDQHVQAAKQSIYKTQVETLAQSDASAALAALERNKAILGPEYPVLDQRIRAVVDQGLGQQAAQDAIAKAGQSFLGGQQQPGGAQPIPNAASQSPGVTRAQFAGSPALNVLADTVAAPESGGRYDVRFDGSPTGSQIADLSQHPGIAATIPAGLPHAGEASTAAGRYQFIAPTWAAAQQQLGLPDFSPQSQDQAFGHVASQVYQQKTGRDLNSDLTAGKTDLVADALHSTWPSINQNSIERLSSQLQTASAGGGNLPSASFKASAYDQLLQDPRLRDNPIAFRHALSAVNEQASAASIAAMQNDAAVKQRSEAAAKGYVTDFQNGKIDGLIQRVANDPNLSWETQLHLGQTFEANMKKAVGHDTADYGPALWDTYQRIHLPDGDPNRITSPAQLYAMGPSGDLTLAGIDRLTKEMADKKTPEGEAESSMKKTFLTNARGQITGSSKNFGFQDPKGDEQFLKFQAQFWPAYQAGRDAGKSPGELLNPDSKEYLGKSIASFRRPDDEKFSDLTSGLSQTSTAATVTQTFKSADDVVAAVKAGKIPYADGVMKLRGMGYIDQSQVDQVPFAR